MPSRLMNRSWLAGEDWRRMARISAEYCLFWVMVGSFSWMRRKSHGIKEVSVPKDTAIAVLDERFSRTPKFRQFYDWGGGY